MNFVEAVKLMREGKLLKRKEFDHHFCKNTNIDDDEEVFSFFLDGKWRGSDWIFTVEDFEADDWEVVKETKGIEE